MIKKFQNANGFTIVEIIIVIAIITLLISIGIAGYRFFEKSTELENTAQNIIATLKLAQTKTTASEQASQYGVHFENDKYILFKGNIYESGAEDNKTYNMPNRLEIYDIALSGGGSNVIFQRISGNTEQNGAISLRIISDPDETKTIIIQSYGRIELEASFPESLSGPITDTKHLHFNLGWTIQNSIILTLNFPDNPEVIANIEMADYFKKNKTKFDWKEKIDVNGEEQDLHVHTHLLDAINTILCIHRPQDKNNKPLNVSIDSKDIISYDADGTAYIGVYGGEVEIQ